MKRGRIAITLAALTVVQSTSFAQVLLDLPNPNEQFAKNEVRTPVSAQPLIHPSQSIDRVPEPLINGQRQSIGDIIVGSISMNSGGELLRIELKQALVLSRIEIAVLKNILKVKKAEAVTVSGARISLRELVSETPVSSGRKLNSGNLNISDKIVALEVTGESMAKLADIKISAESIYATPQMTARRSTASRVSAVDGCSSDTSGDSVISAQLGSVTAWMQHLDGTTEGSEAEKFAIKELRLTNLDLINTLQQSDVKDRVSERYMNELMEYFSKLSRLVPSSSPTHSIYGETHRVLKNLYSYVATKNINCMEKKIVGSSSQLVDFFIKYDRLMSSAEQGSAQRSAYSRLRNLAQAEAVQAFQKELKENKSFSSVEKIFFKYDDLYTEAPDEHLVRPVYRQFQSLAYQRAHEILRDNVSTMSKEQRFHMIKAYDFVNRNAKADTLYKSYVRNVLGILSNYN